MSRCIALGSRILLAALLVVGCLVMLLPHGPFTRAPGDERDQQAASEQADGGIMITASHNPADYNGLKLVRESARPISADTGLVDIRGIAERDEGRGTESTGTRRSLDVFDDYIGHMIS